MANPLERDPRPLGAFGLDGPADLLKKLRHDYSLFEAAPNDAYCAFNFFVTAEHLVDWVLPNDSDARAREKLRAMPLLATVSHLANGAKHFGPLRQKHQSVADSSPLIPLFGGLRWAKDFWADDFWETALWITLTGQAAKELGANIPAVELARQVLAYWEQPGLVSSNP